MSALSRTSVIWLLALLVVVAVGASHLLGPSEASAAVLTQSTLDDAKDAARDRARRERHHRKASQ